MNKQEWLINFHPFTSRILVFVNFNFLNGESYVRRYSYVSIIILFLTSLMPLYAHQALKLGLIKIIFGKV